MCDVMNQEIDKLFQALSNEQRRRIISHLYKNDELSFTEIMELIERDTGSTSFHLRKLNGLISQRENKKYFLTDKGLKAYKMLKFLEYKEEKIKTTHLEILTLKRVVAFGVDFFVFYLGLLMVSRFGEIVIFPFPFDLNFSTNFIQIWRQFGVLFVFYLMIFEGHYGFSVGKYILGLRVLKNGREINYKDSFLRNLSKFNPYFFLLDIFSAQIIYLLEKNWNARFSDLIAKCEVEIV